MAQAGAYLQKMKQIITEPGGRESERERGRRGERDRETE